MAPWQQEEKRSKPLTCLTSSLGRALRWSADLYGLRRSMSIPGLITRPNEGDKLTGLHRRVDEPVQVRLRETGQKVARTSQTKRSGDRFLRKKHALNGLLRPGPVTRIVKAMTVGAARVAGVTLRGRDSRCATYRAGQPDDVQVWTPGGGAFGRLARSSPCSQDSSD